MVMRRDTSRVIQTILKLGTTEQKSKVQAELARLFFFRPRSIFAFSPPSSSPFPLSISPSSFGHFVCSRAQSKYSGYDQKQLCPLHCHEDDQIWKCPGEVRHN
jgi:hypothetical protein